ncbi:hypothetical protein D0B54_20450 [Solimonas sp. K1W22B-7]|uniref:hypothetical protein n=1 Tax=Solimonas sp. K1W22B-7 TaxID=2303331 RepID=UPI000E330794|nr:hypothetical protein [Solimonas sp. K1W22B-7]AXQ30904.1 hypothetical protein D0B54_20450 [Solimonas sp. K1W22B-7]
MTVQAGRARRISCIGFDWRAEVSLKETLALLRGKTREAWQYSDELTAEVVVYETHNALAQAMVRRCQAEGSGGRVFFPSSSEDDSVLTLRYPFGASRLVACLDSASLQLQGTAANQERSDEASLCQRIDDALRTPGSLAVAIRAGSQQGWLKLPERQLFWSQPLGIEEIAQLLSGDVEVQALGPVDAASLRRLEAGARHPAQAEPLLWAIGIARSKGSLLHRLDIASPCRLRRWPDFGAIGRRNLDIRCASLLTQRELAPTHLAMMAGIPLGAIGNFLNACALIDVLEAGKATALPQAAPRVAALPSESGFGSMLRRIRMALTIAE